MAKRGFDDDYDFTPSSGAKKGDNSEPAVKYEYEVDAETGVAISRRVVKDEDDEVEYRPRRAARSADGTAPASGAKTPAGFDGASKPVRRQAPVSDGSGSGSDSPVRRRKTPGEQEVSRLRDRLEEQGEKVKKLQAATAIFAVVAILAVIFAVFLFVRGNKNKGGDSSSTVNVSGNTTKTTYELNNVVNEFNSGTPGAFTASVQYINGYEYFVLSSNINGKDYDICYQNEFPNSVDNKDYLSCFITDGANVLPISTEYEFDTISKNLPEIVKLGEDGAGFLYTAYEEGTPSTISLINLADVSRVGSVNFATTLPYYFTVGIEDEVEKYISVTSNDVKFVYNVTPEIYDSAVDNGSLCLKMNENFKYKLKEDSFEFSTVVSFGPGAYIGEYSGSIVFSADGLKLENASFGAYVTPDFDDPGNKRLITPFENIFSDPVKITGSQGGYYLLEKYKNIELSDIDSTMIVNPDGGYRYITDAAGNKISTTGIDVSTYQGEVNWAAVKAAGVDFAFVRAGYRGYSEGALVTDERFEANVTNASAAGLGVGVYFFSQAVNADEGREEANYVLSLLEGKNITGPVVFDTEYYYNTPDARGNSATRAARTEAAKAFLDTIAASGRKAMIYANTRWLIMGVDLDQLSDYDVWYAYYGDEPLLPYKFAIWQYSDEGSVSGVDGGVDMDVMVKDVFK